MPAPELARARLRRVPLGILLLVLAAPLLSPAAQEPAPPPAANGEAATAAAPARSASAPGAADAGTPAAVAVRVLCEDSPGAVALGSAQWNGWGRDLDNSRYQPEPALRASDVSRLALKWAFAYPGEGVAGQPTVVDGRAFVAAPTGRIYALDAKSGCIYWSYEVGTRVRSAMTIGESAPPKAAPRPRARRGRHQRTAAHLDLRKGPSALYFGDEHGTVYALDAEHGTLLWKTAVESHPLALIAAAPVFYRDRVYVATASSEPAAVEDASYACCTFRGSVAALDAASGRLVWKTYTVASEPHPLNLGDAVASFGPAGVPVLGAPTLDVERGLLYVATGRAYASVDQPLANAVVALDLKDGAVRWAKQPGPRSGEAGEFEATTVLRAGAGGGRHLLLAAQRSGAVYALDPDRDGEVVWQAQLTEAGHTAGSIDWGVAADHHTLYVPLSLAQGGGSLVALDLRAGARRWQAEAPRSPCAWGAEDCPHGQSQAITVIPGVAFCGALDGHLRAYSTITGKVLWDADTARDYRTVNGLAARGGALDEGGATIVNGVVYVNSGYGRHHPGNVLLAYSVDGK